MLKPQSHISTDESLRMKIRSEPLDILAIWSVDGLPKTTTPVTLRHQHGQSRTNPTATRNQSYGVLCTNMAKTRIFTDKHDIDTDHPGPSRQRHGPTRRRHGPNTIYPVPKITRI
ncbi:hypothetical protein DPMN_117376 [Dreissena polymorpha]|uniref:Uncharacterized protein n=1 Tax=Dreissena polymorpha TaxID=45954 RepID=A0A9D4KPS0_DREPO|nr:hypothetical protein DPMN_117376 [Dreissena polymorpha]